MWEDFKKWWAKKKFSTQSIVGAIGTAQLLYLTVPQFHDVCVEYWALVPDRARHLLLAGVAVWMVTHRPNKDQTTVTQTTLTEAKVETVYEGS